MQSAWNLRGWSLILTLLCTTSITVLAQRTDSTRVVIEKMDSIRQTDSTRRAAIQLEVERLKVTTNNRKREQILNKIRLAERDDSIKKQRQHVLLEKLKSSAKGFPVVPFGDTLFLVYTRIGSFSAYERALAITWKIESLYDDYEFKPDSLTINLTEAMPEIGYHDTMVMGINDMEALWYGKQPEELAKEYQAIIQRAIRDQRGARSLQSIGKLIGTIILIIAGIFVVVWLINKLFKNLNKRIIKLKGTELSGVKIGGYQLLDSDKELRLILFLVKGLRLTIIVLAFYLTLPLMFGVFPWTRGFAVTLTDWILTPLRSATTGFINYLPNLFAIGVIAAVTIYFIKVLKFVANEIEKGALKIPGFYPDWAKPTLNIVKFLVYAFGFIVIFPYLPGSDSPIFRGVSVFVGVLFSLGSSSAISNAVAGLVITYMRPFKIGDRIKIGELSGDVIEKSLLVTRIRTIKNENITIPNSSILSGHTINYTSSAKEVGLILYTSVTIGYDTPWKQIHELLMSAALVTNGISRTADRKPFVLQTSLDDFYVSYQINVYTEDSHRMPETYSELHQNIQDKFNEAGVEILSPHYRSARDGNRTTVPENFLPPDYKAPAFEVKIQQPKGS